jgi:hypothetical protein
MGADLWYHQAPWHADPQAALHSLQAEFVVANYDLPEMLSSHLNSARQALALTQSEGEQRAEQSGGLVFRRQHYRLDHSREDPRNGAVL